MGDQLNINHSWYAQQDESTLYLIAELHQESNYDRHHIQKLCGFFAAMAEFANQLCHLGHQVLHLTLDDTAEFSDLNMLIAKLCDQYEIEAFEYQHPEEYRLSEQLKSLDLRSETAINCFDSEHFLLTMEELPKYLNSGKHNRM